MVASRAFVPPPPPPSFLPGSNTYVGLLLDQFLRRLGGKEGEGEITRLLGRCTCQTVSFTQPGGWCDWPSRAHGMCLQIHVFTIIANIYL